MKKAIGILSMILICLGVGEGIYFIRKGFSLRRIEIPISGKLEIWDAQADRLVAQPFRYLGRGRQCFAFESGDGKWILKIPRTDIYQIPFIEQVFPFFGRRLAKVRKDREKFLLNSMRIAFENLRGETGVAALHLCQTENSGKMLRIIDPLGLTYHLPLHKTPFILQVKQPLLMEVFSEALAKGDREKAKGILDALAEVVVSRGMKGVGNKDGSFLRNYGYDGQKGYLIDIGTFYLNDDLIASTYATLNPIRSYLQEIDQQMGAYLEAAIAIQFEKIEAK